jgi:hypothetical protein
MGQQIYKIPRLTDRQIQRVLQTMAEEFGAFGLNMWVSDHGLGTVNFPSQSEPIWQSLLANESELLGQFSGGIAGVTVYYYRGGANTQPWERSPSLDDLGIDTNGIDEGRLRVASRLIELAKPVQVPKPTVVSDQVAAIRAIQEATFSRLQLQQEALYEQTISVRAELDAKVTEKESQLATAFEAKSAELAAEHRKRQEEVEAAHAELDARRKELDDSDNTFARRQIRERMLSDVAARVQNFGVSETTARARQPVAFGMVALATFLGALLLWTVLELQHNRAQLDQIVKVAADQAKVAGAVAPASAALPPASVSASADYPSITVGNSLSTERLWLWVRLSLTSLGLVASLLYYIRWQNSWAQQFATTEQALQQFYIDVNRANWVVETCLEWKKEANSEVPATLVESLARGLFTTKDSPNPVLHPADELASALLGSASKLSLAVGGSTVEIDKPGKIPKTLSPKENT